MQERKERMLSKSRKKLKEEKGNNGKGRRKPEKLKRRIKEAERKKREAEEMVTKEWKQIRKKEKKGK